MIIIITLVLTGLGFASPQIGNLVLDPANISVSVIEVDQGTWIESTFVYTGQFTFDVANSGVNSITLLPYLIVAGSTTPVYVALDSQWGDMGTITPGNGKVIHFKVMSQYVPLMGQFQMVLTAYDIAQPGMKRVAPSSFVMGKNISEITDATDRAACMVYNPQKTVQLTYAYYIDSTEVTQGMYSGLMDTNPSYYSEAFMPNRPVEQVTFYDALLYCNERSKSEQRDTCFTYTSLTSTSAVGLQIDWTKKGYRLPTEAEYECAHRAGTTTDYYWGSHLFFQSDANPSGALGDSSQYAWYYNNSFDLTHTVGTKLPNAWGLYDLAGNNWEWVQDNLAPYTTLPTTDPRGGMLTNSVAVLRGGYWGDSGLSERTFVMSENSPTVIYRGNGFRCVRVE